MIEVVSIVFQPKDRSYEPGEWGAFIREPVHEVELIAGHGINGDRKAGKNPKRQLNILSVEWLAEQSQAGLKAAPGEFGEQMVLGGLSEEDLRSAGRLRLGESAEIEITMPREGCERLEAAQEAEGLAGRIIGVLAHVHVGGTVRVGDSVTIVTSEPAIAAV